MANITNDAPLSLNFTTLDATISSGAAPSFMQEYNLTNSDLVLGYRDKKWDITVATLDDITSHFTLSSQAMRCPSLAISSPRPHLRLPRDMHHRDHRRDWRQICYQLS